MSSSAYVPLGWENSPSQKTPINAINLNKMDSAIKYNRDAIINLENNYLPVSRLANNLVTTAANYGLDARQGKVLDDKIGALNSSLLTTRVPVGTDANTIAKNGTYYFNNIVSNYSNIPPDGANGIMFVMSYASRVFQIYGSTNFNRLYIRCTLGFGIEDSYWTTWKEL